MSTHSWLSLWFSLIGSPNRVNGRRPRRCLLQLECLEQREVPSLTLLSNLNFGTGPAADLIMDGNGNIFGTTYNTVFEVPSAASMVTTLASFNGSQVEPWLMRDSNGILFGTTNGGLGGGIVFEIRDGRALTLATFTGGLSGTNPNSRLVEDSSGDLFGTTSNGGLYGDGTVFELQAGSRSITTLAQFNGSNGASPSGDLFLDSSGNLFGIANGGSAGGATWFELPTNSNTITTLASFVGSIGGNPSGYLIQDANGNFFGTANGGSFSSASKGVIFEIQKANGTFTISTVAGFDGTHGTSPQGGVLEDSSGVFFGTTTAGGAGYGTVYEFQPGIGFTTIADFSSYYNAGGNLVEDSKGDLIGATSSTLFEAQLPKITTTSLPNWIVNSPYQQTINAINGTGFFTYSVAGNLPPGLSVSNNMGAGIVSGTPTTAGSYTFTVTATDFLNGTASQTYTVIISGTTAKYVVTVQGSGPIQAESGLLIAVQAADQNGTPVAGYSGPASATATISPSSASSNFPTTVTINSSGLGLFLANIHQTGTYTITVANSSFSGSTGTVTVLPGPAVKLTFGVQPVSTPTGVALPPVTVDVVDSYGNLVTTDNTDTVVIGIASGPGSFTTTSTTTATVTAGVAIFNNLILAVPGAYTLSAVVPTRYTGPNSSSFTVLPLQVAPGSFAGTPAGFALQFNGPILVNAVTPAMYGVGQGRSATVTPTVTLTQISGTPPSNATLPYAVPGSVVVDNTNDRLTFVETATTNIADNNTPVLLDGTYVAHITSKGVNGLQALNSGGGYLDGTGAGTPGHDFTATFTVNTSASGQDVLWLLPTADGPGQLLNAPGMNQAGGGYPVYLDDRSGKVTSIHASLTYYPSLLTVMPTSTATFTVTVPTPGMAVLIYSGPALAAGVQTPIGFITATVPAGTATSPVSYKSEDLLLLSNVALNSNGIAVTTVPGLHLVAYVGDTDGNGKYSGADAVLINRVVVGTDNGFSAYPLVDPTVVADTDGAGFTPADAALQVNEAGVGVPTENLANPPIPASVHFMARALGSICTSHSAMTFPILARHAASSIDGWLPSVDDLDGAFSLTAEKAKNPKKKLVPLSPGHEYEKPIQR